MRTKLVAQPPPAVMQTPSAVFRFVAGIAALAAGIAPASAEAAAQQGGSAMRVAVNVAGSSAEDHRLRSDLERLVSIADALREMDAEMNAL